MSQLMDAYIILFDINRHAGPEGLTVNVLKKTYRKKIFENHPDRSVLLGTDRSVLNERSKIITDAYEILLQYIVKTKKPARRTGHRKERTEARRGGPGSRKPIDETLFSSAAINQVPDEPLTLVHYLYHLGIIDFMTVVDALTWKKIERPYFGKLAREMNLLTNSDTAVIVKNRRKKELFGACAIRLGMLTPEQVTLILAEQDSRTPVIETYLLTRSILDEKELEFIIKKLDEHNSEASLGKSA